MTDKRRLGSTDAEITPIGLGTMKFGAGGMDRDTIRAVVAAAIDGGVSWFDTAELSGRGRSERALTTALQDLSVPPRTVLITTKWAPVLRRASNITRTVDSRLATLQGYPIDLYQIHFPYGSLSGRAAQVRAMADLAREHKISAVGVSNYSARQMEQASDVLRSQGLALASNEVQISLLHRKIERNGVLEAARRLGITLIAYTPLRSGILTGKFHDDPSRMRAVPAMQRRVLGLTGKALARTLLLIDELRDIARAYGATPSQVALAWLVQYYGDAVVAIPGASKPRQAEESAGAMNLRLTDKELARLDEASRRSGTL